MRVLGLQTDIVWEDRFANFSRIEAMLAAADAADAAGALLVFPELSTSGFTMNVAAVAEPTDGESSRFFSHLAIQRNCHVIAGIAGQDRESGLGANEAVCFSPRGDELARYRKMNPFPLAGEEKHYPGGKAPVVFQIGEWSVAPFICYDLRFPEPFREATALGAEILVVIANWPVVRVDHWTTLLRARAIENQAYVVGVNRCGSDPSLNYPGASLIVGPKGETLAQAGADATIVSADLDREALLEWRRDFPALSCLQSGGKNEHNPVFA